MDYKETITYTYKLSFIVKELTLYLFEPLLKDLYDFY